LYNLLTKSLDLII